MNSTGSLPREFGPYLLQEPLGHGSTASVFRATDRRSSQVVAVKIITRASERQLKRFQRELQTLSRLQHRHIVALRDGGILDGRPFLVMDFVAGARPLDVLSQRDDMLPLAEALRVMREVARAIEYAHQAGVLHRDLKPANILVDPTGRARVLDFGVAALLEDGDERLTQTGCLVGTPAYMAPEQARGDPCVQSDVYALGATLYQAVTGLHPYEDLGINPLLAQGKRPTSASGLRRDLPAGVDALIERCLAAAVEDRFPSAAAVAQALDDQIELLRRGGQEPTRAPWLLGLGALVATLLGLAAWAATHAPREPKPAAPPPQPATPEPALDPEPELTAAIERLRRAVTSASLPEPEAVRRAAAAARDRATERESRARLEAVGAELATRLRQRALTESAKALPYDPRLAALLEVAAELARADSRIRSQVQLTKVELLLRRGRDREAARAARAVGGERQSRLRARYHLATALHNLPGRKADAQATLEALTREDPEGVVGVTATARLLSRNWRYNESNQLLFKVVARDPSWRPARVILALGLSFRSRGPQAREVLAPALRQAPDDYRLHMMVAFSWKNEDVGRSLAAFDRSIRLGGERVGAVKWRGITALKGGERARARRDLDRALALRHSADTLVWHGLLCWVEGRRAEAAREWRTAYREDPAAVRKRLGDMPRNLQQTVWRLARTPLEGE